MKSIIKSLKQGFAILFVIDIIFLTSFAYAELRIDSVYPTLGAIGHDLEVTIEGGTFDAGTGLSMYLDMGNKRAIIGAVYMLDLATDVTVVGTTAYVADSSSGLHVIDVSTPSSPKVIGSADTPGYAEGVTVVGTIAYVADWEYGLQVIDISTPSSPRIIGAVDTPGNARGVTVVGTTAYVADSSSGLQVIDVSTPSSPQIIGSVGTPGGAYGITVLGTTAYVADSSSGLQVIDVSTPNSPQIIGSVATPGYARGVTVAGTTAYVADGDSGLQVIDVSTPSSPKVIGSVDTPGYANGVTVVDATAYVADYDSGFQVIDISTPSSPQIISSVDTGSASDAMVLGTMAYVSDSSNCLQIIDVSLPASPHIIGTIVPTGARDVKVEGTTACVAGGGGLQVIDVSVSSSPQIIGFIDMPGGAYGVTILGTTAYVVGSNAFQVIDVSAPTNPKIIGSLDTSGSDVTIVGTIAYIAAGYRGLQVIDVSAPSSPQIIGSVDTPGSAKGITVVDTIAFVADGSSGLQVIDVSTPSSPQIISAVDTGGASSVTVVNTTAYVANGPGGLLVVDVSIPSSPQIIGSVDTPELANDVTVLGTTAYVADGHSGLQIIDVSTPTSPQIIGSVVIGNVDILGSAEGVTIIGTTAYVADLEYGLQVIDVSTPSSSQNIGFVDTGGASAVAVLDTTAYVVGSNAFRVVDVSAPTNPLFIGSIDMEGVSAVAVLDTAAYVVGSNAFQVIDVSAPTNPKIIGSLDTSGSDLTVVGTTAYVVDLESGLKVIDVSVPTNPQIIGSLDIAGSDLTVVGTTAYVAGADFWVIDVSVPTNPQIIGSGETPGTACDIAVIGLMAYVADFEDGLQVIDVSVPTSPQIIGSVDTPGWALHVTVVGNTAYVGDYEAGLQMIDVSVPTSPQIIGSVDTLEYAGRVTVAGTTAYVVDLDGIVILPLPIEIKPVTVNSATSISVTLPSPPIAGHYNLRVFNATEYDELLGAVSFTDDVQILKSKAIIVAGGGPDAEGDIWEETKTAANRAYDVLVHEGFDHDSIWYLTGETGNSLRDGTAIYSELEWAINNWATDSSDLVVFFVDHGFPDNFIIWDDGQYSQQLNVNELDDWLDNLQQNMIGTLTFIYDACYSGTFASKLIPPEGKDRIVITGASNELAYFRGGDSFSFLFWEQILQRKGSIGSAFSAAAYMMKGHQSALINANGNSLTNENEDITKAKGVVIRRGQPIYLKPVPTIDKVSDNQILSGPSSAVIWVSDVYNAESVWAKIVPPDINPDADGLPITNLPTIQLHDIDRNGIYEGTYAGFTSPGTYTLIINAQTSQDIYSYVQDVMTNQIIFSQPVVTLITQMNGTPKISADNYETDDTYHQANVITLNDPDVQPHNFDDSGDVDWVKFFGLLGEIYTIKAHNVSLSCDVVIELYDGDGQKRIAGPKDDAGPGEDELLDWTCQKDDFYFVKVSNSNSNFGENTKYDLKVYRAIAPLSGYIRGTITDLLTGEPIKDAVIRTERNASAISLYDGSYLMIHPAGTIKVIAEAFGYSREEIININVGEGESTAVDFSLIPSDTDQAVETFVTRFYQLCLDRDPDEAGLEGWVAALLEGSLTGSDVAYGFVFSQEFLNQNISDQDYLKILYEAFFNRNPDEAGLQGWLDALESGFGREDVLKGFIYATEFADLCDVYGIRAYEGHFPKAQKEAVEAFVARFYQLCLDRNPDPAGLDGWTNDLLNQVRTGADVAIGFIYSPEFVAKNNTNSEYLTILYKAFFNRDPDPAGWDVWLAELNSGRDRGEVLNGFIYAQEFYNLCADYGILSN